MEPSSILEICRLLIYVDKCIMSNSSFIIIIQIHVNGCFTTSISFLCRQILMFYPCLIPKKLQLSDVLWLLSNSFFHLSSVDQQINNDYVSLLCRQMSDIQGIMYLTNIWFSVQYVLYLFTVDQGVFYLFWNSLKVPDV